MWTAAGDRLRAARRRDRRARRARRVRGRTCSAGSARCGRRLGRVTRVTRAGDRARLPAAAARAGMPTCRRERRDEALFGVLSVREKSRCRRSGATPSSLRAPRRASAGCRVRRPAAHQARRSSDGIMTSPAGTAEGRHRRWLASEPRILLLNDPTRGVDLGANATSTTCSRAHGGGDRRRDALDRGRRADRADGQGARVQGGRARGGARRASLTRSMLVASYFGQEQAAGV